MFEVFYFVVNGAAALTHEKYGKIWKNMEKYGKIILEY
jgi:hypothetical protein